MHRLCFAAALLAAALLSPAARAADDDGDGYDEAEDCDDGDPEINPDADEVCNGEDDNCDGDIDEDDVCGPAATGADTGDTGGGGNVGTGDGVGAADLAGEPGGCEADKGTKAGALLLGGLGLLGLRRRRG